MGGVLGGFLEYASLVFGFRSLALLALATYGASWLMQGRIRSVDESASPGFGGARLLVVAFRPRPLAGRLLGLGQFRPAEPARGVKLHCVVVRV